jgi:pantoate--beta-alanine ligase
VGVSGAATRGRELVVVETVAELRAAVGRLRGEGRRVGYVPTMGALHDGHAELVRTARRECDVVVVSCYVNPTQFGANEDLDRYPRTPEHDLAVAREAGADVLWRPRTSDVYGDDPDAAVRVHVGAIGEVLEGRSRPGHFDGVATVVVRLLGAVAPDALYLGAKDFQQVAVLRRVVDDLLLAVEVREVPTVREDDGLARSSRNAYLSPEERRAAVALPRALEAARASFAAGERSVEVLRSRALEMLDAAPGVALDYLELADARTLAPVDAELGNRDAVLLVAARVGATRLIDNQLLVAHQPVHQSEVRP